GRIDEFRGRKPGRVLCELYAKLLAMVVQHWLLLVCAGIGLLYSHRRAARRIRRIALWLMWCLENLNEFQERLERLGGHLSRLRIAARTKHRAAFQLLNDAA